MVKNALYESNAFLWRLYNLIYKISYINLDTEFVWGNYFDSRKKLKDL